MRWAGQVASMGDRRGACRVWWGNMREGKHLEQVSVDGKIILKGILKKWDGSHGLGLAQR